MRRHTTSATKQSSPLTRYTERTSGLAVSRAARPSPSAGAVAVEREPQLRADAQAQGGGIHVRAVAADHAAALEVADALGHGLAGEPELLGQVRGRPPAVPREGEQQRAVGAVEAREIGSGRHMAMRPSLYQTNVNRCCVP